METFSCFHIFIIFMPAIHLVYQSFYYSKHLGAFGFCSVISLRKICWSDQGYEHAAMLLARGLFWFTGLSGWLDAERITLDLLPCQYQLLFTVYFSYFFHCNKNVPHFRKFGEAESYVSPFNLFRE